MAKRRQSKPDASHFHGSGRYVRQLINCLEKVNVVSGYNAYQIFDDWTQLVEVCLEALPTHLTSIAQTGQLAEVTPETKQIFERIRSRYQAPPYRSNSSDNKHLQNIMNYLHTYAYSKTSHLPSFP